ncbi:MAG: hypothetical protein WBW56_00825, partial [Syntrophobacteraceae bacterium]
KWPFFNPENLEPLAELNKTFTPVTSAVQWTLKNLDSGSQTGHFRDRPRRNDVEGLLQEALLLILQILSKLFSVSASKRHDGLRFAPPILLV